MKFRYYLVTILLFLLASTLYGNTPQVSTEKIVILGSGPAGLTAAIYTARGNLNPLVIEGPVPGGQLTETTVIENFPGFPDGIEGNALMDNMRQQAEKFGTRFLYANVTAVDLSTRPFKLTIAENHIIFCEALIIATGSSAKWLGLPSETALRSFGVSACATCDGFLFRDKEVVVVGGGDTALEEALTLSKYAKKVTVIHRRNHLRASKHMQERAFANNKIQFIWNSTVDEILDVSQKRVTGIVLRNVDSMEKSLCPCDGVFIAIGHQPNTALFQGQLELDDKGYIVTRSKSTRASVPGVFAAGDVADPVYRQAISAAGTGAMAAIDVDRFLCTHNTVP